MCSAKKQNDGISPRCRCHVAPTTLLRVPPSCLPCSQGHTPVLLMRTLRLFVLVFEVIGLLLLVNLLIAMMASSCTAVALQLPLRSLIHFAPRECTSHRGR